MNEKERRSINVAQKSTTFSETLADSRHKCLLLCSLKNLNMKMLNTKSIVTFLSWWETEKKEIRKDWNVLFPWSFAKQNVKYSSQVGLIRFKSEKQINIALKFRKTN